LGENEHGRRLGETWICKQLLKAFRENTSTTIRAKYSTFWDPEILWAHWSEEGDWTKWPLPKLTKALATLILMEMVGRCSDLVRAIRTTLRESRTPSEYMLIDVRLPKETGRRNNNSSNNVEKRIYRRSGGTIDWLSMYQHYEKIPVIKTYRQRNMPEENESLLLTFGGQIPGKPPHVDTIRRWVAEVMWSAGIPDEYQPHAIRGSMVTWKIQNKLESQLRGIWKSEDTRKKFYDRSQESLFNLTKAQALKKQRKNDKFDSRKTLKVKHEEMDTSSDSEKEESLGTGWEI